MAMAEIILAKILKAFKNWIFNPKLSAGRMIFTTLRSPTSYTKKLTTAWTYLPPDSGDRNITRPAMQTHMTLKISKRD